MAVCPSCGRKLHLYNWKQTCPSCGVNLVYFNSNENLLNESEKAEIEHAKFQPRVDRGKASYFGSPLTIARLAVSVLPPLGVLCLPIVRLSGGDYSSVSAITLYKIISEKGTDSILNGITSLNPVYVSLAVLALSIVMILVNAFFIFGSLGPHGKKRNIILSSVNTAISVIAAVIFLVSGKGSLGIGAYLYILILLSVVVLNIIIAKKGIPFEYKQCLIGGLDSHEYFALVEQGLSQQEIRRKMLVALADMQEEANKRFEKEKEEAE